MKIISFLSFLFFPLLFFIFFFFEISLPRSQFQCLIESVRIENVSDKKGPRCNMIKINGNRLKTIWIIDWAVKKKVGETGSEIKYRLSDHLIYFGELHKRTP